jgi:REP element-mobilizing transposase RayT
MTKTFLYAHVIWAVRQQESLLTKTVRVVLNAHLQKSAEEKGVKVLHVSGYTDHMHVLLHLHPAQNVAQVVRQLKAESTDWLNATKLLPVHFEWDNDFAAYSVSPNVLKQVMEYFDRQDEYHKLKSFDSEMEVFGKLQSGQV